MEEQIRIEALKLLKIKPGDIVLVKLDKEHDTLKARHAAGSTMRKLIKKTSIKGVQVLVLRRDDSIEVLRKEN